VTDRLLQEQWRELRDWLDSADVMRAADRPSGLGAWTVAELVAHLGLSLGMVAEIRPAPDGVQPLSLAAYVAAYPPAAEQIAELTRTLARDLQPDLLAGVDRIVARAWDALGRCDAAIVLGRRGPLRRTDYVASRLVELVVHADDLATALGDGRAPVLPDAERAVASALRDVYIERTGRRPAAALDLAWIRRAAGRVSDSDPCLPLL
jgi:uncharacterized protein (TIGR03083 family)